MNSYRTFASFGRMVWLRLALLPVLSCATSNADQFKLENEWISLKGTGACVESLRVDPAGTGNYGSNWILSAHVGEQTPLAGQVPSIEQSDGALVFRGISVPHVVKETTGERKTAYPLWPGQRLGQRFTVKQGGVIRVGGVFPTWNATTSALTLSLRRQNPEGELLATKRFESIPDAGELVLHTPPLPADTYYLEASNPSGPVGWYGRDTKNNESESAYMTGMLGDESVPIRFLTTLYREEPIAATLQLSLEKNMLKWNVKDTTQAVFNLVTPWIRDGYETSNSEKIVFSRFIADNGVFRPVHQFKRRENQQLPAGNWIDMTGTRGFDVRFHLDDPKFIEWEMTSESMRFPLGRSGALEVLPHKGELSNWFPRFFSSDPKLDENLNAFLLSHGFNFGTGVFPEWKEWQSRILAWSANPQREEEAGYLMNAYQIRPDGYVHTWGGFEGWPFPFEDKDKDGKNDLDTRHFTSNPGFILGCANHALWSRNRKFVETILPRARKAMQFQLEQLEGKNGLIVIKAEGHGGRHLDIGSNYWDILPFGWKDGYSNIYFYASLEAMAKLETLAASMGFAPGAHTPEYFAQLRRKVREEYQRTFWDEKRGRFIGCVDVDGQPHDYGFTFLNMEAVTYGLADTAQVERIYHWMETEPSATGNVDTYSRWGFAPRCCTEFNPPHGIYNLRAKLPKTNKPSWWFRGWRGTEYDEQCQSGGAILYTSFYDIMGRTKFLGTENGYKRFDEVLARYAMPDHLSGGSPLYRGERSQGGPTAGQVGVEHEFPESGLVPCSFLYAFLGIEPTPEGLSIKPALPKSLSFAGVRNMSYGGKLLEIKVTKAKDASGLEEYDVEINGLDEGSTISLRGQAGKEPYLLKPGGL